MTHKSRKLAKTIKSGSCTVSLLNSIIWNEPIHIYYLILDLYCWPTRKGKKKYNINNCRLYMYVCLTEMSYWLTQTPALLRQVQMAAANWLKKAEVKVAALFWIAGGWQKPYIPPAVCWNTGRHKMGFWT